MTTVKLTGIAASDGIAIAPVYLLTEPNLSFETKRVEDADAEVARLDAAYEQAIAEVSKIRDIAKESLGAEEAQVFEAHLMVLQDPEFTDQVKMKIKDENVNAEAALHEVSTFFINMFA
ncbi:phosphoenolpyruvate-utilizing N-terminal domain-containing protein, partial [Globicatella sulfidifaciens]